MKHIALIAASLIGGCTMPAPAVELTAPDTIKLTKEEVSKCEKEGGCVVITVEMLRVILDAAQDCRRKGSI